MALGAGTVWEVETGGSDTLNGGAFDPGQTAGMMANGVASSANTSAPVFSCASYNFVAGDVGAWLYIASGSNWIPGWYSIVSVAANAATLDAAIGHAVSSFGSPNTAVGCATTASPINATFSVDYSQQAAAEITYTDLASAGTGLTVTSAAFPFAKNYVGNCIVITGGTNFNTGRYVVASISGVTATVVGPGNITTGAGASGTGGLGGSLASPGQASSVKVSGNTVWVKSGTYSITSASTNIAGGCVSDATSGTTVRVWEGYGSIRGDLGTAPIFQASGISSATIFSTGAATVYTLRNLTVDGASLTSILGFNLNKRGVYYQLSAINCTNIGINCNTASGQVLIRCRATNITGGTAAIVYCFAIDCEAYTNTVPGFTCSVAAFGTVALNCIADGNSGASTDGFLTATGTENQFINCVAYNNGRDGFRFATAEVNVAINCIAEINTGTGFNASSAAIGTITGLYNCATYLNTGGSVSTLIAINSGPVVGTGSFFILPGSRNFALNNTAGGGALARAAGTPGVLPAGTTTGYADLGAVQHQDPPVIFRKNTALSGFSFPMFDPSGNLKSGLTVTGQRVLDGGAVAAMANSPTEISAGIYTSNLAAADVNASTGTFLFTAFGASSGAFSFITQTFEKNIAVTGFSFIMRNLANGSPMTGLTVTAQRVLDGGAVTTMANAVTEISAGIYTINLAAADVNCNVGLFIFTSSGAAPSIFTFVTQA